MRQKKLKLFALLLLGLGISSLKAQEVVPATGGNGSGSGGSISYSIGQVTYETNAGPNGSVLQGVQQPYEISVVTGIPDAIGIKLQLNVYPNPTSDLLNLKVEDFRNKNLSYQLFKADGSQLECKNISANETEIYMGNLAHGVYLLKISDGNNEVKTFKIIKN